jgi:hypothetical protein
MKTFRVQFTLVRGRFTNAGFVFAAMLLSASLGLGGTSIFDDDYTPPKAADPAQPVPSPGPTPEVPAAKVSPAPSASPDKPAPANLTETVRCAIPDRASREKVSKLFEEVYGSQLKDHLPAGRCKLAEALLAEAGKTPQASPDRFVLLMGALQSAEEGQNLPICFEAAKELSLNYRIDELATKIDALAKLAAGTPSSALAVDSNIQALLDLAGELVAVDSIAVISQVEAILRRVAPLVVDAQEKTKVNDQIRALASLKEAAEHVAPAVEKLKQFPDDANATLAVGTYLCFVRGQWEKGLPFLAKSSDAQLKKIASAELTHPQANEAIIKLADGWSAVAAKLTGYQRSTVSQHAAEFYRRAEEGLTGLEKLAIEKRLAQLEKVPSIHRPEPARPNPFLGTWEKSTMSGWKRFVIQPGGVIVGEGKTGKWVVKDNKLYIAWPDQNQVYDAPVGDVMTGKTVPSSPKDNSIPLRSKRAANPPDK